MIDLRFADKESRHSKSMANQDIHTFVTSGTPRCASIDAMNHPLAIIALFALAPLLTACCPGAQTDERGWPRELVLGLVPALEAEALVENLDPLTQHLQSELGIPVRSFVPADYTGLVEALGSGRADIGMLPPFAAMLGMRRYDLEPVLISVRLGETGYQTQWLTNDRSVCDEPPTPDELGMLECHGDIEQVRGQTIAFTDPNSTSGYLFPALQLLDAGIDPESDIRSLYVGGHDAAVLAVRAGDVRFGTSYDDARSMVRPQYPDVAERVIRFNRAPMIPNDGVTLRPGLPEDLRQAIIAAFMSLEATQQHLPRAERVLWVLYEIDGFQPMTADVYDPVAASYDRLRR